MRIHYLQHAPFETPGTILDLAAGKGFPVSGTRLFAGESLPEPGAFDLLVVMGGPMSAGDEHLHPWLAPEKRCIERAIGRGKRVLGICLGAQLVAEVLGGRVFRNEHREIGWLPVRLTAQGTASPVFGALPGEFPAFHWHGDTFAIPPGCIHAAESAACAHQAFEFERRVFGVQFHLEMTSPGIRALLENCTGDLAPGRYVQTPEEILAGERLLPDMEALGRVFLERIQSGSADIS